MAEARIIDSRKVPSVNQNRLGKFDQLITYNMGPGQTFLIVMDAERVTDAAVLEAIKRDIAERGALVGRTFTV